MLVSEMHGGTNTPGVPEDVFAMPAGMRMRYDVPTASLAECVTGYAIYAADDPQPTHHWFLPAPMMICIAVDAGTLEAQIRNYHSGPLGPVSLNGATTTALRMTTRGGISVGIGISALGWARLSQRPAAQYTNQVVPLTDVLGDVVQARFIKEVNALSDDAAIQPVLDGVLSSLMEKPHPMEDLLRGLSALLMKDSVIEVAHVATHLGVSPTALRSLCRQYFGIVPKVLMRRARFLRSWLKVRRENGELDYGAIDSSYFDASHFLRDASTFLGTTPRRFAAIDSPFLHASLRARAAVLGAATQSLHQVGSSKF
jgi:AraC-like DNA-binding protein